MALSYSTGFVHTLLNTVANGGKPFAEQFKNGIIEIYGGSRPTDANSAVTGTLLGTVTLNGGAFTPGTATNGLNFGTAANRSIDKVTSDVWQFSGSNNGTATWFRLKGNALDSGASNTTLPRIDGTISAFGGDATLSNTTIVQNNIYTFSACLLAWPS